MSVDGPSWPVGVEVDLEDHLVPPVDSDATAKEPGIADPVESDTVVTSIVPM